MRTEIIFRLSKNTKTAWLRGWGDWFEILTSLGHHLFLEEAIILDRAFQQARSKGFL